jgi:class 3 adenylate cyclase/tetratricopeptide (TPR) repeat protein
MIERDPREPLQRAIDALEAQRAVLGDAVVDSATAPLRAQLARLAPRTLVEERRYVTVLFVNLSGFRAFADGRDPEEVNGLLQAYFAALADVLARHGGVVEQYLNDAVMALFGIPVARENDAEHAVHAALEMQASVAALLDTLGGEDTPLALRVGINTGTVLVTLYPQGSRANFNAIGDAVNVASRVEHAAPPGGVLISQDTYRHVRGLFEVEPLPPLNVKGKPEPLQTYRVLRAVPPAFYNPTRGVEGLETRMIGRAAELQALGDAFARAQAGAPQWVTVCGEPGIGKSRLLAEFTRALDAQGAGRALFRARITPELAAAPYGALRALLAERCHILDGDPSALVREKLERGVAEFVNQDATRKAHFIGALAGYDLADSPFLREVQSAPQVLQDRAVRDLGELFAGAAARAPVLVMLEDVHWADEPSRAILERLMGFAAGLTAPAGSARLMLIDTVQPEFLREHPAWSRAAAHMRIDLQPLAAGASRELVDELLRRVPALPAKLREMIVTSADGCPFYIEELVRVLIDDGVIVPHADADWQIDAARLPAMRLPPTLAALLQARLDSLTRAQRETLQRAAVIGREFWDAALAQLGSRQPAAELRDLCARDLIYARQTSAFDNAREYAFKHALLRDVVYETTLKRDRRAYHALAAAWLAAAAGAGSRGDEYAARIAEHYALAGEAVRAAGYLRQAAAAALAVHAVREAHTLAQRALDLLEGAPESGALRMAVHQLLADACEQTSDHEPAAAHYAQALQLAQALADADAAAAALNGIARVTWKRGDFATAGATYHDALAEEATRPATRSETLYGLTVVTSQQGQLDAAWDYGRRALAIRTDLDDRPAIARSLNILGVLAHMQGDNVVAWSYYEQALDIARALGDRRGIQMYLQNLGGAANGLGRPAEAEAFLDEALAAAPGEDDPWGLAMLLANRAEARIRLGKYAPAHADLRAGLELTQGIDAVPVRLALVLTVADLELSTGRAARAAELIGLVATHPLTDEQNRIEVAHLRARLAQALPVHELAAAIARGARLDLDAIVQHTLMQIPVPETKHGHQEIRG